ncbi:unnamed protein product [Bursaphelenchus okinawaensis]|uniref:Uncharacterized protein n=1 Tax=Bursaphelenchus okinawaensis TaxID=465554 RepID=A0A811KD72_9BILA|nr:unnamed protein product [Bursaphelenchus okinawaensis]CAG9101381.1 unnamed protein product [Bursaphelenchus okinawaensis]
MNRTLAETISVSANELPFLDGKCLVRVRFDNKEQDLDASELIELAKSSQEFALHLLPQYSNQPQLSDENALSFHFLQNNDLISPKSQKLSKSTKSCHFESVNSDLHHSAVNLCDKDVSGILRDDHGNVYFFGYDEHGFFVQPQSFSSCDKIFQTRQKRAAKKAPSIPRYYADYLDGIRRYVELVFIADKSVYDKYGNDEEKVHHRMESIANVVNSMYAPINIRITLVYADIWKDADVFPITENSDDALNKFLVFRKGLIFDHPHDNAHLLTQMRFNNNVIGKAYRGTMCSYDFSGGVIFNDDRVTFVASTVAHEMGHNFGMEHDLGYPDPCKCESDMCIMSPSSGGSAAATYWSDCSLENLQSALRRGVDYCLQNVPSKAFGGAKCGNGIVEDGEDCDCGSLTECPNKCCIPSTCKLAENAECASGDCCDVDTCKPKSMATQCRASYNSCDLPEYCDGENPKCPPDFFVQNGLHCPDAPEDYCYEGQCGSRDQQCQYIWGETGKNSEKDCYRMNVYGNANGNCGYDPRTERYAPCEPVNKECGRLHCTQLSERPVFGDPSTVYVGYTSVRRGDGKDVACRSVRTTYSGGKRQDDPGMVPDGARCGRNEICVKQKCSNLTQVTEMVSKCDPTDCHGKGICNNVGNCHCLPGYGGTACDIPGYGGSVNSGPASDKVFSPGMVFLYVFILGLIAFIGATIWCRRKKGIWLHKKMWKLTKKAFGIEAVRVPVRKAPPPPGQQNRRSLSPWEQINAMWNRHSHQSPRPEVTTPQTREVLNVGGPIMAQSYMPTKDYQGNYGNNAYYSRGHETATLGVPNQAQHPYNQPYEVPTPASYEQPPPDPDQHNSIMYGDDFDEVLSAPRHIIRQDKSLNTTKRPPVPPPKLPEARKLQNDSSSESSDTTSPTPSFKNKLGQNGTVVSSRSGTIGTGVGVMRKESTLNRPAVAPPPPPHKPKNLPPAQEPKKFKPPPPVKPPVSSTPSATNDEYQPRKINVKALAAQLDSKLSNV